MLEIKTIRQKNPKGFCKWEIETKDGEYVVIRYKNYNLDIRVASSHDEFVMGKSRCVFRNDIRANDANHISIDEIINLLDIKVI